MFRKDSIYLILALPIIKEADGLTTCLVIELIIRAWKTNLYRPDF